MRAEQQLAQQSMDRCGTRHLLPYTGCAVVLADACLGLVGEVWLQRTEP